MSDLTDFRDHARRLSTAEHRDDCERIHRIVKLDRWLSHYALDRALSCPDEEGHDSHGWVSDRGLDWDCPGLCGGCMPAGERVLWARLADEADAYLDREPEETLL